MFFDTDAHLMLHTHRLEQTMAAAPRRPEGAGSARGRRRRRRRRRHRTPPMSPAPATSATPVAGSNWSVPDPAAFRALMGRLVEPVVVITGQDEDGRPLGLTVSSFSSVSLTPPLVAFSVGVHSTTWGRMAARGRFAVNVLSSDQHDLADRFAAPVDRFDGVERDTTPEGTPVLRDALATMSCEIDDGLRAGDHEIIVGRILGSRQVAHGTPLAYHGGAYASVHATPTTRSRLHLVGAGS